MTHVSPAGDFGQARSPKKAADHADRKGIELQVVNVGLDVHSAFPLEGTLLVAVDLSLLVGVAKEQLVIADDFNDSWHSARILADPSDRAIGKDPVFHAPVMRNRCWM